MSFNSSRVLSNRAVTWLNGFSGLFSNSLRIRSTFWFRRSALSSFISSSRRSSKAAYAALNRRSGCRSTWPSAPFLSSDRASRALSMPLAFTDVSRLEEEEEGASSPERSSPRDCLAPVLPFDDPLLGSEASSSARRASFSAFLRAASAALLAVASLRYNVLAWNCDFAC